MTLTARDTVGQMIRAVFFDFYGTLAGWQPSAGDIQRRAAAAEGLDVDPDRVERAYPTANALLNQANADRLLRDRPEAERVAFFAQFEQTLLQAAGYDVSIEAAWAIWIRVRATPKEFSLYPDSLPALGELHRDGLTLGVISNMGPELPEYVRDVGLAPYVTVTVSSAEVGVAKPHPAVFESALRKAGVSAAEAVHIGDGYESDVVGAANAGLHAIFLAREEGAPAAPEATAVVRSLSDVHRLIAQLT